MQTMGCAAMTHKQRRFRLFGLLLAATLGAGCSAEYHAPAAQPATLYDTLIGHWASNCALYPDGPGAFIQEETYFGDGAWFLVTTQFENADCTGPFSETVTEGAFFLGRPVATQDGLVATEIDWLFGNDGCYSLIDYDRVTDSYVLGDFNDSVADCATPFDRSRRMDFGVVYERIGY